MESETRYFLSRFRAELGLSVTNHKLQGLSKLTAESTFHEPAQVSLPELHNLFSSPNVIKVIKPRRMRWTGPVAQMRKARRKKTARETKT
jgi:hypothetical protein